MTFVVLALWWTLNVSTPPFTDSPPPSVSPPQHEATTTAVPTTSPVAEVSNEVARAKAAAKAARNQCRSMTSDAECDLLYGVIVTRDGSLLVPKQLNRHFAAKYPEGSGTFPPKKTRHHMKPVRVTIVDISDIDARRKRDVVNIQPDVVAFYQTPVIGAGFLNVWHTISDQYLMFTHTLDALLGPPKPKAEADDIKLVWVTESPMSVLKADPKYCTSLETCRRSALFTAFDALFQGLVMFAAEGASTAVAKLSVEGHDPSKLEGKEVRFEHLLLGLNYRCSPIPDLGVEAPVCHAALKVFKQRLLYGVGLDPHRRVTASELQCPIVHVMSRQKAKYRRIHNWDAYVAALTQSYVARQCDPARLQFITLSSKMSLAAQITTIWNVTILMAGRGGGTGYIPALPDGGGYFSISGSDRWSPYRLLTPDWINITHYRAKMTHEEDASRPCRRFRGVEDANRCGYFIENPQHLAEALWSFVDVLRARPGAQ